MIEVALASDANYFCGLLVTMVSLARHADPAAEIRFNVLDGGIPDADWQNLVRRVAAEHPRSVFRRFPVDDARFSAFPAWNGRSRLAYARLLLPALLSDADFVVYCDVDFLWGADIVELWALRNERALVLSTPERCEETRLREGPWLTARGYPYSFERYFCSGLCFCNLRLWREYGVAERVLAFLDAHTDVPIVDQTALNAILGGAPLAEGVENVILLPGKWQLMSRFATADDIRRGCVLHYAGDAPWSYGWRTQPLTDVALLWHAVYGELLGGDVETSLRHFFASGFVRFRRAMFHLLATPGLREILLLLYRLTGRGGYISRLRTGCRRLPWRELAARPVAGREARA